MNKKNYYKDVLTAKDRIGKGGDIKLFFFVLGLVFVGLIVMAATKPYGL